MLYDSQGHQGMERTIALCRECFYWNIMQKNVVEYVNKTAHGVKWLRVIIVNGPLDHFCFDFNKMDPSAGSKEDVLVLTDVFSKFSWAFVT